MIQHPKIKIHLSNTKTTTKLLNKRDKITVYSILKDVGLYDLDHIIVLKSARMKYALKYLPKAIGRILPAIEKIEDSFEEVSDDLEGQVLKLIKPSNINDFYIRLEILIGLKLSGYTNTLTEASNLIDELYKRSEI